MIKAELEQRAEEKAEKYSEAFIEKGVAKASYAKGYIAGATENGIQWHDLRKDPNDLPKEFDVNKNRWEMEKRITKHIVQNEYGERVCCFGGTWYYEEGDEAHPIAWCEIPTFKE